APSTAAAAARTRRRRTVIEGPPLPGLRGPGPGERAASYQQELGFRPESGAGGPRFRLLTAREARWRSSWALASLLTGCATPGQAAGCRTVSAAKSPRSRTRHRQARGRFRGRTGAGSTRLSPSKPPRSLQKSLVVPGANEVGSSPLHWAAIEHLRG